MRFMLLVIKKENIMTDKEKREEKEWHLKYSNYVNPDIWDEHTKIVEIKNGCHRVKFDEEDKSESITRCNYCGNPFFYPHATISKCSMCSNCRLISIDPDDWDKLEKYHEECVEKANKYENNLHCGTGK